MIILSILVFGLTTAAVSPDQSAKAEAAATRPGDEQMSCDAIVAEMKTLQVSGVSAENRAEAKAAGEAMRAESDRQMAAAAGQMAAQTAATAAASAATAAGVQGADAALLAGQDAAQTQGARNKAQMDAKRERTQRAIGAATADLQASMQANPRFGRLIELAGSKGCSGDF